MTTYTTIRAEGEGRYEEKKSVFLAFARPLQSEKAALDFIAEIKASYPDARHHVYAYTLRDHYLTRYSDDHEPQGTAGLPVLDLLKKSDCSDAGIVVVRYFGGTLLGTGGLVRAYTAAAKQALEDAGIVTYRPFVVAKLNVNYGDYQKIPPFLARFSAKLDAVEFGENVEAVVGVDKEEWKNFENALIELCSGRVTIEEQEERFDCDAE